MWNLNPKVSWGLLLAFVALSGCSMDSARDGESSLFLDLTSLRGGNRFSLTESGGVFYGLGAPPTSATGFTCYVVNVTGPGIVDTSPNPQADLGILFDKLLRKESYCSYPGIVTPTFALSASGPSYVALQVLPGGLRLVQLAGVTDSLICASGSVHGDSQTGGGGNIFEVGRSVQSDFFGDRSVDLTLDWPATAAGQASRAMDCGDGSCANVSEVAESSATTFQIASPSVKFAFKIPTVAGKYLRNVKLNLRAFTWDTSSVDATVTVYEVATGGGIGSAAATVYTQTTTLTDSANPVDVDFSLHHPTFQYLQMQSAKDYWIVLSSANAAGSVSFKNVFVTHNAGGANSDVQSYSGSVWGAENSGGVVHAVYGCGN